MLSEKEMVPGFYVATKHYYYIIVLLDITTTVKKLFALLQQLMHLLHTELLNKLPGVE